jgi:hypothetical protein
MKNRYLWVILVGLAILLAAGNGVIARQATPEVAPPAATTPGAELVTLEPIAFGRADELPAAPAVLQLVRMRIAPGGEFSAPDGDPGASLIVVEAGALTVTLTRPVYVTRGLGGEKELIPENQAFTLGPGASVVAIAGSGGTFRNDGAEEAVFLGAGIRPTAGAAATPTG